MASSHARPAAQAGAFYSSNPEELREEVEAFIDEATPESDGQSAQAFVAPHAGYRFSGPCAGHVYRQIRERDIKHVIVLAPSHHASFNLASLWDGKAYATPLGEYPIDTDLAEALRKSLPGLQCQRWADKQEHSLEVQVPFLQVACPEAKLLPLVVGRQDPDNITQLGDALWGLIESLPDAQRERVIVVASTDGYHGGSLEDLKASDKRLGEVLTAMDFDGLYEAGPDGHPRACGIGPIGIAMQVASNFGATRGVILKHATSADVMPHQNGAWVVGYTAAMFV